MSLPCVDTFLLVLGVALGNFKDGIELTAVGIDPFWLFEFFELSIEISPKVNLHQLLIDTSQLLH